MGGLSSKGTPAGLPLGNTEEHLKTLKTHIEGALAAEISSGDVAVRQTREGLTVSLREIGFFDNGSDTIKANSAGAFARLAEVLRQANDDIRVEGHTDNVPIHNSRFSSNWDLSAARATATVRLLIQNYGFAPERLSASGYAEFHPAATNDTAQGRAMNRRVDIVIPRNHG